MTLQRFGAITGWAQRNGLFFALLVLIAVFSILSPHFLTRSNLETVLLQVAVTGLVAVPGAMLILSGYVDLSVGSVAALAAVVFGELMHANVPGALSFVLALAAGTAWGLTNGLLMDASGFRITGGR